MSTEIQGSLVGLQWSMQRSVGADPNAGAEAIVNVPAGEIWWIQYIEYTLVTSAVAGNRFSHLKITDGANNLMFLPNNVAQAASLTRSYRWVPTPGLAGFTQAESGGVTGIYNGMGDRLVLPGGTSGLVITTSTGALDGGDNYGIPAVVYRKLVSGSPLYGMP